MKLFETNFSKEKPELIAAPVLLSTFKFQFLNNRNCKIGSFRVNERQAKSPIPKIPINNAPPTEKVMKAWLPRLLNPVTKPQNMNTIINILNRSICCFLIGDFWVIPHSPSTNEIIKSGINE